MEIRLIDKIPARQTPVYHVSQGDQQRVVGLKLCEGTEPINITGTETLRVRYRLQDGTVSSFGINNVYSDTDTIYAIIPNELTAVIGYSYCKLFVNSIGYKAFYIEVEGR